MQSEIYFRKKWNILDYVTVRQIVIMSNSTLGTPLLIYCIYIYLSIYICSLCPFQVRQRDIIAKSYFRIYASSEVKHLSLYSRYLVRLTTLSHPKYDFATIARWRRIYWALLSYTAYIIVKMYLKVYRILKMCNIFLLNFYCFGNILHWKFLFSKW